MIVTNIPEYDFDIIELIKEGFRRIEGVKGTFVIAFVLYIFVAIVLQIILGFIFPSPPAPAEPNYINQQIVTILSYPVLMPLMIGIIMLAINHSRGEQIDYRSIFNYYHLTGTLSLAAILIYEDSNADNLSAFTALVKHWADKYKLELRKVENKNTYYIIGHK